MNNDEIKKIIEKYIEALNCLIYDHSETGLKDDLKFATQLLSQPTQGEGEKTLDELRAEFSREAEINIPMVIEMNIRNSGRNVLHKYIEWLEQKLTGKE